MSTEKNLIAYIIKILDRREREYEYELKKANEQKNTHRIRELE